MKTWLALGGILLIALGLLGWQTRVALRSLPVVLAPDATQTRKAQVVDRHGEPLSVTYQNPWNMHDIVPLHAIPAFLQEAFLSAEDQRFYRHGGVDWQARMHALAQNLRALRVVRGASTITEQVVRMLHPRPRTLWSRWLEGVEARRLEARFPKMAILEFYLNQVPYARQRRGVQQAARLYFDRDLATLSQSEMLMLAVLVRAPSYLDPRRDPSRIRRPLVQLATRLDAATFLVPGVLRSPTLPVQASHFLRYVRQVAPPAAWHQGGLLPTTLDTSLQQRAQALLESRLRTLQARGATAGALLAVDHHTNAVLAWVSAGGSQIDTVRTPRQPGSTLKPFLYALALERGWTAATLVHDTPLEQPIGIGLHAYRNYSGQHYGPLRVREALGNSLNVPAIRTIDFVGLQPFLERLHQLGFQSLTQPAHFYGNGLALGNGEVSLFELVQAYATLARQGVFLPLRVGLDEDVPTAPRRVYSAAVSTLIAHILADPEARQREFGRGNLLRFPVETAVKTGTSSDYRDAWALGFSQRYTVGVWMGNLSQQPMQDITGSLGPALVLRALFAELNRGTETHPLALSPRLSAAPVCRISGQRATPHCPTLHEWFVPGTSPEAFCPLHQPAQHAIQEAANKPSQIRLLRPTPGLRLAMDPRIPDTLEAFPFALPKDLPVQRADWRIDSQFAGSTGQHIHHFLWHLTRGAHTVQARVWLENHDTPFDTPPVEFVVK